MLTLRDDQEEAVEKLSPHYARQVISSLGWGKTVVGVELDRWAADFDMTPTLVVCRAGAVDQWRDCFIGQFGDTAISEYTRDRRDEFLAELMDGDYRVYILTWSCLRKPPKTPNPNRRNWAQDELYPVLMGKKFNHIIADEAHAIGNRGTQQRDVLTHLKTTYKTAVTGTPMKDYPHQWWGILNWLYPKDFSSYWKFFGKYVASKPVPGRQWARTPTGTKNEKHLWRRVEPFTAFYERVTGTGRTETTINVDLSAKQRRAYESMRKQMWAWVGARDHQLLAAPVVISRLQRLQMMALAHTEIGDDDKVNFIEPSSKLDALEELLEDNPTTSFLVYSQFRGILELASERLGKAGIPHGLYLGGMGSEREEAKRQFASGRLRVMLATIAAGSESIDGWQHSCNTVVFLDRSWSPTANEQAIGRLDREGQQHVVNVIDIVARKTVDAKRRGKIELKDEWIQNFLDEGR